VRHTNISSRPIYRKTSNISRVSKQAGLEMGVDEIDESEDENNEVLIDADDAD